MLIKKVQWRNPKNVLLIRPGIEDGKPLPGTFAGYSVFLGQIVNLAMFEGMTRLGLGVDPKTNESWMQYYGPFCKETHVWFDVVAPEFYVYPKVTQVCFSLACLDSSIPIKGVMPAIKNRQQLSLEFKMRELNSLQLSWPAEYCDRWRETIAEPYNGDGDVPRGVAAWKR